MTLGTIDPYKPHKYTLDYHIMAQSSTYLPSVEQNSDIFSANPISLIRTYALFCFERLADSMLLCIYLNEHNINKCSRNAQAERYA